MELPFRICNPAQSERAALLPGAVLSAPLVAESLRCPDRYLYSDCQPMSAYLNLSRTLGGEYDQFRIAALTVVFEGSLWRQGCFRDQRFCFRLQTVLYFLLSFFQARLELYEAVESSTDRQYRGKLDQLSKYTLLRLSDDLQLCLCFFQFTKQI